MPFTRGIQCSELEPWGPLLSSMLGNRSNASSTKALTRLRASTSMGVYAFPERTAFSRFTVRASDIQWCKCSVHNGHVRVRVCVVCDVWSIDDS
mmetsp:Transcript_362/g.1173  ORF Transcript_362/g.1173 Transcript_362/m.1173 type:complete len:94 (-) Transcript_362:29-310(-)